MAILDLQRKIMEAGRIRIGQQVASSNGKSRPAKLDTFRLTSADRVRIEQAAQLYGGQPRQWDAPAGRQWEVVTAADELPVIVPPSAMAFSQFYEMWSAGGCQRRCDGAHESISDRPCLCDPDNRDCNIHTRLSVMIRDLPGLGLWRIDTSGWYAAIELSGAVDVIQTAAGRGTMLPARLRLEQRSVKRPGRNGTPETRRFAVPVLDIEITPGMLLSGPPQEIQVAVPISSEERRALPPVTNEMLANTLPENEETNPPPRMFTPVPPDLPTGPQQSIAEQSKPPPAKRKRANSAPEIPRSGRSRAGGMAPPDVSDDAASMQPGAAEEDQSGAPSSAQKGKIHALFSNELKIGKEERADRLGVVSEILKREIGSFNNLTFQDCHVVIDTIESWENPEDMVNELLNIRVLRETDKIAMQEQSVDYPESEIN